MKVAKPFHQAVAVVGRVEGTGKVGAMDDIDEAVAVEEVEEPMEYDGVEISEEAIEGAVGGSAEVVLNKERKQWRKCGSNIWMKSMLRKEWRSNI